MMSLPKVSLSKQTKASARTKILLFFPFCFHNCTHDVLVIMGFVSSIYEKLSGGLLISNLQN